MIIWSESLDRIIPLCQEFEERLIKLLWRSRPLINTPSASSTHHHGDGNSPGNANGSLVACSGSGSVEALALSNGGPNATSNSNGTGNGTTGLGRINGSSSLALNLLHHPSNNSIFKGPYGEQGREFDEVEMDEKGKVKVVSGFDHVDKSEDGYGGGRYKRTWYGKKVFVPSSSLKQGDDLERYGGEKRPVRLYAPLYNGLAAGIALGILFWIFGEETH